ncbi:MAG: hypothetical protein EPN76_06575 [Burkholderiaceae bacterium]|nr:MAG: hypothetical protein EPN76_06575 [Burkholderiaceae bacterium]TAM05503.1 MAG: hypothetical protein EPN67_06590 [Pusillimonas sp.]
MRFLFLAIVIANLAVLALGEGVFGQPPHASGMQINPPSEVNPQAVRLGTPVSDTGSPNTSNSTTGGPGTPNNATPATTTPRAP